MNLIKKIIMKIRIVLANIWAFVSQLWKKVDEYIEKITPIAIKVVEQIKNINESTTGDVIETILSSVIPGTTDDVIIKKVREKLREYLPNIIKALNISNSIAEIEDANEQLKSILNAINMSSDETKNAYYHSLSVMILNSLSDGKLTWSESIQIAEYYYSNIYKK